MSDVLSEAFFEGAVKTLKFAQEHGCLEQATLWDGMLFTYASSVESNIQVIKDEPYPKDEFISYAREASSIQSLAKTLKLTRHQVKELLEVYDVQIGEKDDN
jgi:hypothetical protein